MFWCIYIAGLILLYGLYSMVGNVMDLSSVYRDKSASVGSKTSLAAAHLLIVLVVLWMLFGGGIATAERMFGAGHSAGSALRRLVLAAAAILYFLRVLGTLFAFIKRKVPWSEVATIAVWVGIIEVLFAYFGGRNEAPVGFWTLIGGCLVLVGSGINTGSEWHRKVWKRRPESRGHLLTAGLWRYSRHVNYFGDLVLFTGWVMMTGQLFLLIIPVLMFGGFAFSNVPAQDRYLAERYGEEYAAYAGRTARLIPFIY